MKRDFEESTESGAVIIESVVAVSLLFGLLFGVIGFAKLIEDDTSYSIAANVGARLIGQFTLEDAGDEQLSEAHKLACNTARDVLDGLNSSKANSQITTTEVYFQYNSGRLDPFILLKIRSSWSNAVKTRGADQDEKGTCCQALIPINIRNFSVENRGEFVLLDGDSRCSTRFSNEHLCRS